MKTTKLIESSLREDLDISFEVTESSLREDLDISIEYLEGALGLFEGTVPPEAMECLGIEIPFGFASLLYGAGATELRRALGKIRSLQDDLGERFGEPADPALARAVIELDPIVAIFPEAGGWKGVMGRARRSCRLVGSDSCAIMVPVRGTDKPSAERRIAWLHAQLGVPAGARSESPSGAAERRAA